MSERNWFPPAKPPKPERALFKPLLGPLTPHPDQTLADAVRTACTGYACNGQERPPTPKEKPTMATFEEAYDVELWDDENIDMAVCGIIRNSGDSVYIANNLIAILRYVAKDLQAYVSEDQSLGRWWANADEWFQQWRDEAARG